MRSGGLESECRFGLKFAVSDIVLQGLVDQIKEVPKLRLLDREFAACEFLQASTSYRRLLVRRMSLYEVS